MKILMVSPYPPRPDGIGVHARNLVNAIGDKAAVAVLTKSSRQAIGADPGTVRVERLLRANPSCVYRTVRVACDIDPDVVHYQFNIPALGVAWVWAILAGLVVRWRRHARLVFTLHEVRRDMTLLGPVGPLTYRCIAMIADKLIVYTDEARHLLVERCRVSEAMITVMPHGSPEASAPVTDAERADLGHRYGFANAPVLDLGYIHPDKGIEYLIEAIAEIERSTPDVLAGVEVLIAGHVRERQGVLKYFERKDREYEARLHTAVRRGGLEARVRFIGFVPQTDMNALMQCASCAVLPYVNATQSGVLNLLVPARTPVIATNLPGLAETLGDAAVLVEPENAHDLADALRRVLGDPSLRETLATRMAERHGAITFATVAVQLLATYERLSATTL